MLATQCNYHGLAYLGFEVVPKADVGATPGPGQGTAQRASNRKHAKVVEACFGNTILSGTETAQQRARRLHFARQALPDRVASCTAYMTIRLMIAYWAGRACFADAAQEHVYSSTRGYPSTLLPCLRCSHWVQYQHTFIKCCQFLMEVSLAPDVLVGRHASQTSSCQTRARPQAQAFLPADHLQTASPAMLRPCLARWPPALSWAMCKALASHQQRLEAGCSCEAATPVPGCAKLSSPSLGAAQHSGTPRRTPHGGSMLQQNKASPERALLDGF
jgi:hypothetical protein